MTDYNYRIVKELLDEMYRILYILFQEEPTQEEFHEIFIAVESLRTYKEA